MALHVSATQAGLVRDESPNIPIDALVVAGTNVDVARTRREFPSSRLTLDYGAWRDSILSLGRNSALDVPDALFSLDVDAYVREALDSGADEVLYPSLAITRPAAPVLEDQLRVMATYSDLPGFIPHLVLPHSALNGRSFDVVMRSLSRFGLPVALTTFGDNRALTVSSRIENLRELGASGFLSSYLATDPVVALDMVARGVSASVGIGSSFRIPGRPGTKPNFAMAYTPAVFFRPLLETRSPSVVADWFAGTDSGVIDCLRCGDLTVLGSSSRDRVVIANHNVHALLELALEIKGVDPGLRREWARRARSSAIACHPVAALRLDSLGPVLAELALLD